MEFIEQPMTLNFEDIIVIGENLLKPQPAFTKKILEPLLDFVDWNRLSYSDLTNVPDYLLEMGLDKLNWEFLSKNETVPEYFFTKHLDRVNWTFICLNPKISEYFFERYGVSTNKICWTTLCANESISQSFFEKHGKFKFCPTLLCNNKKLSLEFKRNFEEEYYAKTCHQIEFRCFSDKNNNNYDLTIKKMEETEDIEKRRKLFEDFLENLKDKNYKITSVWWEEDDGCEYSSTKPTQLLSSTKEYTIVMEQGDDYKDNHIKVDYEKMTSNGTKLNLGYHKFLKF